MRKFILYSIMKDETEKPLPDVYQTVIEALSVGHAVEKYQETHGTYWTLVGAEEYGGWPRSFESNKARAKVLGIKFPFNGVVCYGAGPEKTPAGPRKPVPALPFEVWHTKAFDPDAAMAAVRSISKVA